MGAGIVAAIPGLSAILGDIEKLFPKSPPKEGPLSNITENNMHKWAKGIADAGVKGFGGLTGALSGGVKLPHIPSAGMSTSTGSSSGIINLYVNEDAVKIKEMPSADTIQKCRYPTWK